VTRLVVYGGASAIDVSVLGERRSAPPVTSDQLAAPQTAKTVIDQAAAVAVISRTFAR